MNTSYPAAFTFAARPSTSSAEKATWRMAPLLLIPAPLLLNTVLTVEAHKAGSHRGKGWETFTTEVIKYLNETRPHLVFILWGRDARNKKSLIDAKKHLILESPHPSPLSAYNGFFGNHHFSKTNEFLKAHDMNIIEW